MDVSMGADIFNRVYPPGAFFSDMAKNFRPLKFMLLNFRLLADFFNFAFSSIRE